MAQAPWLKPHGSSPATPLFHGLSLAIPLSHASGLAIPLFHASGLGTPSFTQGRKLQGPIPRLFPDLFPFPFPSRFPFRSRSPSRSPSQREVSGSDDDDSRPQGSCPGPFPSCPGEKYPVWVVPSLQSTRGKGVTLCLGVVCVCVCVCVCCVYVWRVMHNLVCVLCSGAVVRGHSVGV